MVNGNGEPAGTVISGTILLENTGEGQSPSPPYYKD
jgi:hypothetical protein